ncbi:MAG: CPXCG motif-containing cysteine-rich protein [Gammaproteobacteria bacterium]|nr:MAG: CPXCG motif-containing cysteine-rich protein [Gammaproteobacteria bacterium]
MNNLLTPSSIDCSYCGERLEILIDSSAGNQDYVEDCQVCCSPIEISVQIDSSGEIANIQSKRDTD